MAAFSRSRTVTPVCGSGTSPPIWVTMRSNWCDPPTPMKPRPFPSELMYATALARSSSAWCSAHSVEPRSPCSSASHPAYTMVRLGRHPVLASSPTARASSMRATMPDRGSPAPKTHPSMWLPRTTHSSG